MSFLKLFSKFVPNIATLILFCFSICYWSNNWFCCWTFNSPFFNSTFSWCSSYSCFAKFFRYTSQGSLYFYILKLEIQNFQTTLMIWWRCKLFHDGGSYHIGTNSLICSKNQWTDFYIIRTSVMKELMRFLLLLYVYIPRVLISSACATLACSFFWFSWLFYQIPSC